MRVKNLYYIFIFIHLSTFSLLGNEPKKIKENFSQFLQKKTTEATVRIPSLIGIWMAGDNIWEFYRDGSYCQKSHYVVTLGVFGWNTGCGRYVQKANHVFLTWENGAQELLYYEISDNLLFINGVTFPKMDSSERFFIQLRSDEYYSSTNTGGWSQHNDSVKRFSINLPSIWKIRKNIMGTDVIAVSPEEFSGDPFQENINVIIENFIEIELHEYAHRNIRLLTNYLTDFRLIEAGKSVYNNTRTQWIIATHQMGGVTIKMFIHYFVINNKGCTITCSTTPGSFQRYQLVFKKACSSLKLY